MPIVSINEDVLIKKLGRSYTDEEFEELFFRFGLELDEITSEKELAERERGQINTSLSAERMFKIEIPANRYDLLCSEGLTRALMIFNQQIDLVEYRLTERANIQLIVKPDTQDVRPYVVAAVLRKVNLTEATFDSLIALQEKLHQNICRKRSLVAIGTHDLDTLQPPFVYDAKPPSSIKFIPLNKSEAYTADGLMQLYSTDSHLKPYLPLIQDKPKYPVITDANNVVLSMPPIINGNHSRVTVDTHNIFIEATATDLTKASIVLDTIVTMFSEYCKDPFTVEPVEVIQHDNSRHIFPRLEYRDEMVSIDYINQLLGTHLASQEVASFLHRMGLKTSQPGRSLSPKADSQGETPLSSPILLSVRIPPTRHDILHACDIVEDVAIALGYDNVPEQLPQTYCIAQSQPVNQLTDMLRAEVAQAGFTEALSFTLCSRDDISTRLRLRLEDLPAVNITNPKSSEFQVVRTSLLPGILHTIANNRRFPLPIKLFEVQDIVLKDEHKDVGARNHRRLCAVYCNRQSGFEVVHGLLDRVMKVLEVVWTGAGPQSNPHHTENRESPSRRTYCIRAAEDPTFFPGRCAEVVLQPGGQVVGRLGVLHPEVLRHFEITMPCSAVELDVEVFV